MFGEFGSGYVQFGHAMLNGFLAY